MKTINLKTEIPGPKSIEAFERRRAAVAKAPFHSTPVFIESGSGATVRDLDGNTLLDFACGIGVTNIGHAHPKAVAAVQAQAQNLFHGSFNVLPHESYVSLCEKLNGRVPARGPRKSFLVNSGAEAVENAVKVARAFTKRQSIVVFDHAFHGRTYLAMAMTAKAKPYKTSFGPFPGEVVRVPFPYAYRWPSTSEIEAVSKECFERFREVVETQVGAEHVAAVVIEPVLGEGGFVPAPASFMQNLQKYCRQNGIVFIVDEIQSGFGRSAAFFASERLGVEADLVTTAKGLGAGLPIAAVTGAAEILDSVGDGGIGGTYSGNPLACVSALAVFELLEEGSLLANARKIESVMSARLEKWRNRFEVVGDARGLGAMQAIELVVDKKSKTPNKEAVSRLMKHGYENGVVLLSAGTFSNVLRFLVPLVISPEQLDEGLSVVEAGLEVISK